MADIAEGLVRSGRTAIGGRRWWKLQGPWWIASAFRDSSLARKIAAGVPVLRGLSIAGARRDGCLP